jgi:hypothetical protein
MLALGRITATMALLAAVAGCGGDPRTDDSPDLVERVVANAYEAPEEFAVVPKKPLVMPSDMTALPPPSAPGTSRSEPDPRGDALAALGGRPGGRGTGGADRALLAAAGAQNARPDIRAVLAAEDARFRDRNKGLVLDRMFGVFTEGDRYAQYKLDAEAELLRLRARGVWVPQLPPQE